MKTTKIIAIAITIWMSSMTFTLFAQGPPPSGGSGGGGAGAPIDGGAIVMLIGAATLGYKKMRERTK